MLAAAPQLQAALKGIYIDAAISRQMSAGLAVVQGLADTGLLRSVVVLDLGTNGTVTTSQIRHLLATIGPHRTLVLVNTFDPRPWQNEDNRVLAAAARKHHNVVLANWFATIEHRTGLLWDDDVHPRPQGATLYARMVATAVQATRSPRPTASRGRPPAAPHEGGIEHGVGVAVPGHGNLPFSVLSPTKRYAKRSTAAAKSLNPCPQRCHRHPLAPARQPPRYVAVLRLWLARRYHRAAWLCRTQQLRYHNFDCVR